MGIQTPRTPASAASAPAALNRIVGADGPGIIGSFFGFDDPYGDGGGDVFRDNVVLDTQTGFRLEGVEGAVLRRNVVGRPGQGNGAGIVVGAGASDVQLLRNRVRGNDGGDGVRVVAQTADVFLRGNVARGNGGDGFDVRSVSAVVRRNRAEDNGRWGDHRHRRRRRLGQRRGRQRRRAVHARVALQTRCWPAARSRSRRRPGPSTSPCASCPARRG